MYKVQIFVLSLLFLLTSCHSDSVEDTASTSLKDSTLVSEIDTFFAGTTKMCVSVSDKSYFESVFKLKRDTSESNCIQANSNFVTRKNDTLIVKLDNGDLKKYMNNNSIESDNYTNYHFITKLNDINYYVLEVFYYEAFSYLMVNAKTGKETYLCGMPSVSPDKSKVIAGCFDLQAGFVFNGLQLFDVTPDSLNKKWSRELSKWGADNIAWIDNSSFAVEQFSIDTATSNTKTNYILLKPCE